MNKDLVDGSLWNINNFGKVWGGMCILYVITGLGGGGAEKVVCDLAEKCFQRVIKLKLLI